MNRTYANYLNGRTGSSTPKPNQSLLGVPMYGDGRSLLQILGITPASLIGTDQATQQQRVREALAKYGGANFLQQYARRRLGGMGGMSNTATAPAAPAAPLPTVPVQMPQGVQLPGMPTRPGVRPLAAPSMAATYGAPQQYQQQQQGAFPGIDFMADGGMENIMASLPFGKPKRRVGSYTPQRPRRPEIGLPIYHR